MGSWLDSSGIVDSTPQSPNATPGVIRTLRDVAPAHYLFKMESFSLLSKILTKTGLNKYESRVFEASGHKWKLSVYPEGDQKRNGDGFISMQLEIVETTHLSPGWVVNVYLLYFVYDQLRDKYLTIQDGEVRRFHALKKEDGFSQLIPLTTFHDASNGKGERLSIMNPPDNNKLTWRLNKFSELGSNEQYSPILSAGGCEWKLSLYPKGDSTNLEKFLSIYLEICDNPKRMPGWKICVDFKLCVMNQLSDEHYERTIEDWFCKSSPSWGFSRFLSLKDLHKSANGYLVNDTLIVELTINSLIVADDFP